MSTTDERGNTVLSARDMVVLYMPEIPKIEAERNKLRIQNAALVKHIQELKLNLSNSDKTFVCAKCTDNAKSDFAEYAIQALEKVIMVKESVITNLQSQLKTTEQKSSELQAESVELQNKFMAFEEKISALEIQNAKLTKSIQTDKEKSKVETSSTQKLSELSKKTLQEKKDLELRCSKLSKQVSEFEKIVITKRDTFAKERQVLENKITELPKQISTLQDLLEKERQNFKEKKKSFELEKKDAEKRNTKKAKSDLKIKFDTLTSERNTLSEKIKNLEVANSELSEKIRADVIDQSPVDNSTESVCSFKTTSSSIHEKNVFNKKSVKSNNVNSNQIRPSNLFYDKSVDGSASLYVKTLGKNSKKNQMVWRVKSSSDAGKKNASSFKSKTNAKKNREHKGKSFGNSGIYYSTNHLIRIAQKKI
ncbi:hypothetical protein L6452_06394 [Arctium lappa]|uniref:Uncharacterized protein n=1 Tax=Arctium lappa TaxID=4217 RepID=A0ACB9EJ22_ARCLA|nr:hypothetical protein L6452_06394 [Arctium lappa]